MTSFCLWINTWLRHNSKKRMIVVDDENTAPLFVAAWLCAMFDTKEQKFFEFKEMSEFLVGELKKHYCYFNPETKKAELCIYRAMLDENRVFLTEEELKAVFLWTNTPEPRVRPVFSFRMHPEVRKFIVGNQANAHIDFFEKIKTIRNRIDIKENRLLALPDNTENAEVVRELAIAKRGLLRWRKTQLLSDLDIATKSFIYVQAVETSSDHPFPSDPIIHRTIRDVFELKITGF